MDKIVALCKRRGFIFPSSRDLRRHRLDVRLRPLGVLLKTNVKNDWWRAMVPGARRHRRARLRRSSCTRRCGRRRGHVAGFTDPLVDCRKCKQRFRADHLDELPCPRKPSQATRARSRDGDLTEARKFNLMFKTNVGPGARSRLDGLPAPRDRAGHLRQLQERPAGRRARSCRSASRRSARRSATRSRRATSSSARASSSRWRWSSSSRPSEAQRWYEYWKQARYDWYVDLGHAARPPAPARARGRRAVATTPRARPTSSTSSRSAGPSSRASPTAATSTSPSTPSTRARSSSTSTRPRRALHPARDRARRRRRPRDARLARRRLRRGGGRGRDAHRAAGSIRGSRRSRSPCCRSCARTASPSSRARSTRPCAASCRPSTTRAGRSASATAARTRSARRGA